MMLHRLSVLVAVALVATLAGCPQKASVSPDGGLEPDAGSEPDASSSCDGALDCACAQDSACDPGLTCDDTTGKCRAAATCAEAGCVANGRCDIVGGRVECASGLCEPGFSWDSGSSSCHANAGATCAEGDPQSILADCAALHRGCLSQSPGAACGACEAGFVANGTACRPAATCTEANCGSVHRPCTTVGGVPTCGPGCDSGYFESAGRCVSNSVCSSCASEHRVCTGAAADPCGNCESGYVEVGGACVVAGSCSQLTCTGGTCEPTPAPHCVCGAGQLWDSGAAACRAALTCASAPCASGEVCVDATSTSDRTCSSSCPVGAGWDAGSSSCRTCSLSFTCNLAGETGRVLSVTGANGGQCICETLPGYYVSLGGNRAASCDNDHDGWVTRAAFNALNADGVLLENARCALRSVSAIVLRNDAARGAAAQSATVPLSAPLELWETDRNDGATSTTRPSYGAGELRAEQVNSFTKACISTSADVNDNKFADYLEGQEMTVPASAGFQGLTATFNVYTRFSHFLELHEGWFVPSAPGSSVGTYVISERPRLAGTPSAVPFGWPDASRSYWRECARSVDTLYGVASPMSRVGGDFSAILGGTAPAYPPAWRGMTHHSEFKCVAVASSLAYGNADRESEPHRVFPDASAAQLFHRRTSAGGSTFEDLDWRPSVCSYAGGTDGYRPPAGVGIDNPHVPNLSCAAPQVATYESLVNTVVWTTVGYDAPVGGEYARGCINECDALGVTECPGFVEGTSPDGFECDEESTFDFGLIRCGCGLNYTANATCALPGPGCEATCNGGCPAESTLYPVGFDVLTRSGPWMCADRALSMPLAVSGTTGITRFLGEISATPVDGVVLRSGSSCASGICVTAR